MRMHFDNESYSNFGYAENVAKTADGSETLLDVFVNQAKMSTSENFYGYIEDEELKWMTYSQALKNVNAMATYLKTIVKKEMIVGICSNNKKEWMLSEHTIFMLGAISCPVYSTFGVDAIKHILDLTNMEVCFISADKADSLCSDILSEGNIKLKHLIVFDEVLQTEEKFRERGIEVHYFYNAIKEGISQLPGEKIDFADRKPKSADLAIICFTSGTSGVPKGVMLTHKNMLSTIAAYFRGTRGLTYPTMEKGSIYFSYLPLSHIMEHLCVYVLIAAGGSIAFYRGNIKELSSDFKIIKPSFIIGVPRVFNVFKENIEKEVKKKGFLAQWLFGKALQWKYFWQRWGYYTSAIDYLIFNKVKQGFGGNIIACLSGSAPLNPDVHRFLQAAMCCKIFQGYGQTETCAASIVTPMEINENDTVGIPFPQNKIKLVKVDGSEGSEIWVKGDNVFKGYYKNEAATKESFEDGWFKTGDIAVVENGLFKIIGRKKEIFKTSQGEYIVPDKVESIYMCEEIDDILITGKSDRDYIVAVVVSTKPYDDSYIKNKILEIGQRAVKERRIPRYEIPREILVRREPFEKLGEITTPTGKKRRALLEKILKKEIDKLYK